jgi:betaine-aldehyde dehydrogenase
MRSPNSIPDLLTNNEEKSLAMTKTALTVRAIRHWIDGEETGDPVIERTSPATGELIAVYADAATEEVNRAVDAASRAFAAEQWQRTVHGQRADLLDRFAELLTSSRDLLAQLDSQEVGKPLAFAGFDIDLGIAHVRQAAAIARTATGESFPGVASGYLAVAERRAIGVVGLIIPWNFPAQILLQKLPYALAAGCTTVIKPSELTSSSALEIARIAERAGFPTGVVNVVTGYGRSAGQAIVDHPDVSYVSFTGSTATGRIVAQAAARQLKRVGLELGGKAANVVFADADLAAAADGAVFGAFVNQGESCVATTRLIVERSIVERFTAMVVDRAAKLRLGSPDDPSSDLGPLIHHAHRDAVARAVDVAVTEGAVVELGGTVPGQPLDAGAYYPPTVLSGVTRDSALFRQEIFGPVVTVTPFDTDDEAVELVNATEYGLAHSLWTKDLDRAVRLGGLLTAGTVWVNTCSDGSPQLAFGGLKSSGYGRDAGFEGYHEFTDYRTVQIRTAHRPSPFAGRGSVGDHD